MEYIQKFENGLVLFKPSKTFTDNRGSFSETYKKESMDFLNFNPIQENESHSHHGVIRGLHFQKPPYAQAKLVRVANGKVIDVAVDLREGSKTYGQWTAVTLSAENGLQFFIPKGFAHGFIALVYDTVFQYKVDAPYNKESEGSINAFSNFPNQPQSGLYLPNNNGSIPWIEWLEFSGFQPNGKTLLSEKDEEAISFTDENFKTPFTVDF